MFVALSLVKRKYDIYEKFISAKMCRLLIIWNIQ